ncbi:TolB-like translocation protein [Streptomyces sp. NPDC047071]|uniref:TolB family protein n=1 Tax=Streptomyces sp. NPDC047071 TaxID=3154808 RepID=UPI003453457C
MTRARTVLGFLLTGVLLVTATAYVLGRRGEAAAAPDGLRLRLDRHGTVVYVDRDRVRQLTPRGAGVGDGPTCQRAATARSTLICVRTRPGPLSAQSAQVRVYTGGARGPEVTLPVWGAPSRARVSPSGQLVTWTVFRTGDSYAVPGRFSTTAGIYDLRDGHHYGSLEDFEPFVDGERYREQDVNFWGVTFAADDRTFYATMASQGRTWLMRGDLVRRTLTAVRRNVECPSLSPDGRRIAYKKRTKDGRWRLHVLRLGGGAAARGSGGGPGVREDVALAETAHVDDQPAWLDDATLAYARPVDGTPTLFTVPADGSGRPRRLAAGSSPTPATG